MSDADEQILKEFLVESHENLDRLDRDLVALEKDPASRKTLASAFRTLHTLKGTCGFLGFTKLEAVAHGGESVLARLRDGEIALTPEIASALLALVDAVRRMLASIETSRGEGDGDYTKLIESLGRAAAGATTARAASKARPPAKRSRRSSSPPARPIDAAGKPGIDAPAEPVAGEAAPAAATAAAAEPGPEPRPEPRPAAAGERVVDVQPGGLFEDFIRSGRLTREQVELAARLQEAGDPRRMGEILVDMGVLQPDDVLQALRAQKQGASPSAVQSSIRVEVDLLERLMNRVGELVLSRNQLLQITTTQDHAALPAASQRLNQITTELQETVMKTRMQPIQTLWSRLPRVLRDVASECGKRVTLEMQGGDNELDKSVIEAIRDPLTHLVRNAVDHGIEDPATRAANGKPAEGRLLLRAFHEGGLVNLEVSDDGGGISVDRVRARALERGLVAPEQAGRLSDADFVKLIFLPGFSTADRVTNISGRGVGMDVVKANLERIGGTIDVENRPGLGTTMKIKIPLTLAIIPALRVRAGGEDYAVPQANLLELIRLEPEAARAGIERIQEASFYRLRGKLLPLLFLAEWLESGRMSGRAREEAAEPLSIVVVHADGVPLGLVVDRIGGGREIIVKPLGKLLGHIPAYAGATILGDGRVALILDVRGIVRQAGLAREGEHRFGGVAREELDAAGSASGTARQQLLVFDVRDGWRAAVPLRQVARLEELEPAAVERLADREVVQYQGRILPLLRLERLLDPGAAPPAAAPSPGAARAIPVLVHEAPGRSVGLVVERIVDIEEPDIALPERAESGNVLASLVIGNRVTDVLDLEAVLGESGGSA